MGHKNRQSLTNALSPRTSNGKVADESGFESANHWHPMLIYAVTRKICWYAPVTPRNGPVVHRTARVDMAGRSCKRSRRFRSEAILRKAAKARWSASSTSQHGAQPGCALSCCSDGGGTDGRGGAGSTRKYTASEPKATGVPLSECCVLRYAVARCEAAE